MIAYPDTSFLCALYRKQEDQSARAAAYFKKMTEPLHATAALLFEFRQSIRLHHYFGVSGAVKGIGGMDARKSLQTLDSDLETGVIVIVPVDWPDVWSIAERLSSRHTISEGYRAMDILHVATALHLGAWKFLTFDTKQAKLAKAEGLTLLL